MKRMRLIFVTAVALLFVCGVGMVVAQSDHYRVIVHPSNDTTSLTRKEVSDLFLKSTRKWEDGTIVLPVDQQENSTVRAAFSNDVLGRPVRAVRAYWQQRIFSGRAVPPPAKEQNDVIQFVRDNPGAIGYVSPGASMIGVKVVEVK